MATPLSVSLRSEPRRIKKHSDQPSRRMQKHRAKHEQLVENVPSYGSEPKRWGTVRRSNKSDATRADSSILEDRLNSIYRGMIKEFSRGMKGRAGAWRVASPVSVRKIVVEPGKVEFPVSEKVMRPWNAKATQFPATYHHESQQGQRDARAPLPRERPKWRSALPGNECIGKRMAFAK